jgi:hypothetical protein
LGQEVARKQANLGAYEDEKLGIYHQQLHDMGHVFDQARQVRAGLQAVYAERNQMILDTLADMRADTDARTKAHNDRLKEYSTEFDENISKGNKGLLSQLKTDLVAAGRRYSAANKEIGRLDESIQQEIKDCQEHTIAEVKPIAARLKEHADNLDAQIVERHEMHDEYCSALSEHFRVLRERLQVEAKARHEQNVAVRKKAEEDYAAMNSIRDAEDASLRAKLADLREQLKVQNKDREAAQCSVVNDMMHYMDQFEQAIGEMNRAQAETTAKMDTVKKKTGLLS